MKHLKMTFLTNIPVIFWGIRLHTWERVNYLGIKMRICVMNSAVMPLG